MIKIENKGITFIEKECGEIMFLNEQGMEENVNKCIIEEVKNDFGEVINEVYDICGNRFVLSALIRLFEKIEGVAENVKLVGDEVKLKVVPMKENKLRGISNRGNKWQIYIFSKYICACDSKEKAVEKQKEYMEMILSGKSIKEIKQEIKNNSSFLRDSALR